MHFLDVSETVDELLCSKQSDLCKEDREFVMTVAAYSDSGEVVRLTESQLNRLEVITTIDDAELLRSAS